MINHKPVDDKLLLEAINTVFAICSNHNINAIVFEILTAAACLIFKKEKIHYAIFEVGIGGTYDTTNFLLPELCIITNIEKEHINILGDDIKSIASNKAGIIKKQTPVWIGTQLFDEALEILISRAKKLHAPYMYLPEYIVFQDHSYIPQQKVKIFAKNYNTALQEWNQMSIQSHTLSDVILENQVLADIAIHSMLKKSPKSPRQYKEAAQLPCRSELLKSKNISLFLDGAHTFFSIENTLKTIFRIHKGKIILIFGLAKDKQEKEIFELLALYKKRISQIIITKPGYFKKSDVLHIFSILKKIFANCCLVENNEDAMSLAFDFAKKEQDALITVTGSFFLCANCRTWYLQQEKRQLL